jgi:adenosine deaminase
VAGNVELHIHLDQTASYAALTALVPGLTLARYRAQFVAPAKCENLLDFLAVPPRFVALMQDERGLRIVVEDLFDQLLRDDVVYAEIRFAPLLHTDGGLSPEQVVTIVEKAAREASLATGIEARLILCALRHFDAAQSRKTAELAVEFARSLVTGLDLAGDEAGFGLDAHAPAFAFAAERGVGLTAHAGEAAGADSVVDAIERLGVTRIGHGVRAIEDDATLALLQERGIHLEVCPSSNVQIGVYDTYAAHPLDRLLAAGVSLSVNTDGRTSNDVSLAQELGRVRDTFGWSEAELQRCRLAALDAAFLDEATRELLRARIVGDGRPAEAPARAAIQTASGRWVDTMDPDPEAIDIDDIALALSHQCRFGGHCRVFYSVAQHSVIVSEIVAARGAERRQVLAALLHDATEAYLVDLPHPLKHRSPIGPPFRRAERRVEQAIAERFGLPAAGPEIKAVDRALLATERAALTATAGDWPELAGVEPLRVAIDPWSPDQARDAFLRRYQEITAGPHAPAH